MAVAERPGKIGPNLNNLLLGLANESHQHEHEAYYGKNDENSAIIWIAVHRLLHWNPENIIGHLVMFSKRPNRCTGENRTDDPAYDC